MKYLIYYKIFEHSQQADSILSKNGINKSESYLELEKSLLDNNLSSYIGFITSIIINNVNQRSSNKQTVFNLIISNIDVEKLIECLHSIKLLNIDITNLKFNNIVSLTSYVDDLVRKQRIKRFIKNWAPSSLRKNFTFSDSEIKKLEPYSYNYDDGDLSDILGYRLENLSDHEKMLIKKLSLCKTVDEWIDNVVLILKSNSVEIKKLIESNIKLFFRNDEYIVYSPMDYDSYSIPNFEYWCTRVKSEFEKYKNYNTIIYLNLKDKSESYFTYISNNKRLIFTYLNYQKDSQFKIEGIPENYQPQNIKF